MQHLTDLLEGYIDPVVKRISPSPIGETGLTARLYSLCYYEAVMHFLTRLHIWNFAKRHCEDTYFPVLHVYRNSWTTEFLRLMDFAQTQGKANLTVRLFHERFQQDQLIPATVRHDEKTRFDALLNEFNSHKLWEFRCQEWFHLDLVRIRQQPVAGGGDLHTLTALVRNWFAFAAGYVIKGEPRYVTVGAAAEGREFARQFRKLMLARVRLRKAKCPPELWG